MVYKLQSVTADAIRAAIAQASPGDTIELPAGTATLDGLVVIDKAITLMAEKAK